jgi:hypothetical protein
MTALAMDVVKQDNPHFEGEIVQVASYGEAGGDVWAAGRGYTEVRRFRDARGYLADYGYHAPTGEWHLWMN